VRLRPRPRASRDPRSSWIAQLHTRPAPHLFLTRTPLTPAKNQKKNSTPTKTKKTEAEEKRELIFKEDGQEYAQVLRMLGNNRLEAQCIDGIKRLCHIRGKMRKKVWVNQGDIVLIGLREFQDGKGDVILKVSGDCFFVFFGPLGSWSGGGGRREAGVGVQRETGLHPRARAASVLAPKTTARAPSERKRPQPAVRDERPSTPRPPVPLPPAPK